jgi:CubicO group peptidase (beta-lactamase class C family)
MRRSIAAGITAVVALSSSLATVDARADIKAVVDEEVGPRNANGPQYVGVSVGVIQDGARYQFHYGEAVRGTGERPRSNTLYSIGSITKTFTATLLALYNERGWVHVPPAIPPLFPSYAIAPTRLRDVTSYPLLWQWHDVTLEQLAMHHGGVPRDPPGGGGASDYRRGTYAKDFDALFDTLAVCPANTTCLWPTTRAGAASYSNYGYEVLGKVLADIHDPSGTVADAFWDEVTGEIGLYQTRAKADLTDSGCVVGTCDYADYGACQYRTSCHGTFAARAAVGYDLDQVTRATPQGDDNTIGAGAGTLWSTTDDMLTWLGYNMGLKYPYWHQEMLDILPELHVARDGTYGLAWKTTSLGDGRKVIGKGGDTHGFHCWIGWIDGGHTGVIVLFNSKHDDEKPSSLGQRILERLE